ncbi:hypothetical protein L3Q82_000369 [Scortum barcoo]|uniref:Uncharacterized protein n=1 Tax=Scortum barcoo TaxID=214431 RepID=A0ACB8X9H6_9TELE|nr:hypothetical protein L3Q82_000369 [Scortum barcoo]
MWLITSRRAPSVPGVRRSRQARMGLLQPLPVPQRPWSHLTLDFITGLPPSKGNTTVLTVVDRFSKMAHFIPLPKLPSAKETAQVMINHVFRIHGLPTDIVSDRGPQFVSVFWKEFCRLLGATVSLSSGYHLESNGQTERMNQEAGDLPAMPCSPEPDNMEPTPDLDRVRAQHPSHSSHGTLAFSCRPWISATSVFGLRTRGYRSIGSCSGQEKSQDLGSCTGHMLQKGQAPRMKAAADRGHRPAPAYQPDQKVCQKVWLSTKDLHYITRPFQKTGAQLEALIWRFFTSTYSARLTRLRLDSGFGLWGCEACATPLYNPESMLVGLVASHVSRQRQQQDRFRRTMGMRHNFSFKCELNFYDCS